jgi:hypothetical protein
MYFSSRLPLTLGWLGQDLLTSSPLEEIPCESSPLTRAPGQLAWLPRLLSRWRGSQTAPLTLVLRLLASAELRLYRTSLSSLLISRTI